MKALQLTNSSQTAGSLLPRTTPCPDHVSLDSRIYSVYSSPQVLNFDILIAGIYCAGKDLLLDTSIKIGLLMRSSR